MPDFTNSAILLSYAAKNSSQNGQFFKTIPANFGGNKEKYLPPGYDIDFRNLYTINLGIFVQSATGWTSKLYLACIVMRPRRILVGIVGTSTFYTILN